MKQSETAQESQNNSLTQIDGLLEKEWKANPPRVPIDYNPMEHGKMEQKDED